MNTNTNTNTNTNAPKKQSPVFFASEAEYNDYRFNREFKPRDPKEFEHLKDAFKNIIPMSKEEIRARRRGEW